MDRLDGYATEKSATFRGWKRRNGSYDAPCATTFRELFNKIDSDALDQVVCTVLREYQGTLPAAIAVDGKTVRSTRPDDTNDHKLNLFAEAIIQNQVAIDDKSNEIPALPDLLEPLAVCRS
ncbi:hypothetical protein P4E94_16760 [Pontiellaceae bacterium B12219]|nr:hypothetical protein [Pontiellaceae bacterium B12219]